MKKWVLISIFGILFSSTMVHKELCTIYKNELYIKRQALLSELLDTCNNSTPSTTCLYFIAQEIAPELLKLDRKRLEAKMCHYE